MKKLEKNPIYLYTGQPCAICDTDNPAFDKIEGCDFSQDIIIAERANWNPDVIKPILRDISDMTQEEAIEAVNIIWFPVNKERIESVEIKTTPIFPWACIYFKWPVKEHIPEGVDIKEYRLVCGDFIQKEFALCLDNNHHTIRLIEFVKTVIYKEHNKFNSEYCELPIYQSYKLTAYLLSRGFNLGILEEGSYIIRNKR